MPKGTLFRIPCAALAALSLIGVGCSGGGSRDSSAYTGSGQLIDSVVENLDWTAGSFKGTTDPDGSFEFPLTQPITFFIEQINLPRVPTTRFVTPVEMVSGAADELDPAVTQIARFLLTLEHVLDPDVEDPDPLVDFWTGEEGDVGADGDPSNGIQIPDIVYERAPNLSPNIPLPILWSDPRCIDPLREGNPPGCSPPGPTCDEPVFRDEEQCEVDVVLRTLLQIEFFDPADDAKRAALPTNEDAEDHLRGTLQCLVAGEYEGTYTSTEGGDSGTWSLTVARSGGPNASGSLDDDAVALAGEVGTDQVGIIDGGPFRFVGLFDRQGSGASGGWTNSDTEDAGTFTGVKTAEEDCLSPL